MKSVKVDDKIALIFFLPFIKDLIEKCLHLGLRLEDTLEALRSEVARIQRELGGENVVDLRDIDYDAHIDPERFLEKVVEMSQERDAKRNADADVDKAKKGHVLQSQQQQQQQQQQTTPQTEDEPELRPVVIDGNDVGMCDITHTFDMRRIKVVVDYFQSRGHKIYVMLPTWRREQIYPDVNAATKHTNSSSIGALSSALSNLDAAQQPNRLVKREIVHFIGHTTKNKQTEDENLLRFAKRKEAVVVSNDTFRRFAQSDAYREVIEDRLIPYSIIDGVFLPNLTSLNNTLENYLRFVPLHDSKFNRPCPYMTKNRCTFGAKCKFLHPERLVAMGPNQQAGQNQVKTVMQKVQETSVEQKKRFQVILNETLENLQNYPRHQPVPPSATSAPTTSAAAAPTTATVPIDWSTIRTTTATSQSSALNLLPELNRMMLLDHHQEAASVVEAPSPITKSIINNIEFNASAKLLWPTATVTTSTSTSTTANTTTGATATAAVVTPAAVAATDDEIVRELRERLCMFFTAEQVEQIMREHPHERNYDKLTTLANEKFYSDDQ